MNDCKIVSCRGCDYENMREQQMIAENWRGLCACVMFGLCLVVIALSILIK